MGDPLAIDIGRRRGGGCCAEAYVRTKWHRDPSSRFATTNMGRKLGLCSFGGAEFSFNTISRGPRSICLQSTKWHVDPSSRLGLYELWTGPVGEGALGPHL